MRFYGEPMRIGPNFVADAGFLVPRALAEIHPRVEAARLLGTASPALQN